MTGRIEIVAESGQVHLQSAGLSPPEMVYLLETVKGLVMSQASRPQPVVQPVTQEEAARAMIGMKFNGGQG